MIEVELEIKDLETLSSKLVKLSSEASISEESLTTALINSQAQRSSSGRQKNQSKKAELVQPLPVKGGENEQEIIDSIETYLAGI